MASYTAKLAAAAGSSQAKKRKQDWNPLDHPQEYDLIVKSSWDPKKIERYIDLIFKKKEKLVYNSSDGEYHCFTIGFTWTSSYKNIQDKMGIFSKTTSVSIAGSTSSPSELAELEQLEKEHAETGEIFDEFEDEEELVEEPPKPPPKPKPTPARQIPRQWRKQ